ncbi:MAG TPA: hypothetical protein VGH70_00025 [Bradyrhizobium sp.]|jgi:hypothetical protein
MDVVFRNKQWQVTEYGLESVNEIIGSRIPCNLLLKIRDSELLYEWLLHMAEKTWVDFAAFEQAFRVAIDWHAPASLIDGTRFELSIHRGREISCQLRDRRR